MSGRSFTPSISISLCGADGDDTDCAWYGVTAAQQAAVSSLAVDHLGQAATDTPVTGPVTTESTIALCCTGFDGTETSRTWFDVSDDQLDTVTAFIVEICGAVDSQRC